MEVVCRWLLQRQRGHESLHSIVNANGIEFPFVRKALEEFSAPVDYPRFLMQLKCDFVILTYLLKHSCNGRRGLSFVERMLALYFRANLSMLVIAHILRLNERATMLKLASILEYFASVLGERLNAVRSDDMPASDYLMKPVTESSFQAGHASVLGPAEEESTVKGKQLRGLRCLCLRTPAKAAAQQYAAGSRRNLEA